MNKLDFFSHKFISVPTNSYGVSCTSSFVCNTALNLTCPSSSNSCNCPKSTNTIFCDCTKVINNENFWNGVQCQSALSLYQSCSGNYMCKTLTQGIICNNSMGYFQCECPFLTYFDNTTNTCANQFAMNSPCTFDKQCQTIYGFNCNGGICTYVVISRDASIFSV